MTEPSFSRRACQPCGVEQLRRQRGGQARRLNGVLLTVPAALLLTLLWRFDPSQIELPLCQFHAMTGLDCPGCGATRATHELLHGRLAAAWHYNALWVLSLPVVGYLVVSQLRVFAGGRPLPGDLARRRWFWLAAAAAAIAFFVLRNLP
jgi:hypothetical protein